ncbi:MAG: glutamine synthetase family protein [Minwuia sp.]|nr:glutamine synthetase family protein [Minwuia sp.]
MPGNLTMDQLAAAVADGTMDTVLVCMVDMQGRLMGKRFQAEFFLDSGWEETHACNYLLATDLEMVTVEGFAAASWANGYGDYVMKPDLTTLRRVPWLEGTALVLCDVLDHHHQPVSHSPRAVLQRQIQRLAGLGYTAMMASELEFFLFEESYEQAAAGGYRELSTFSRYNEDYHIFQTTKEEPVMRALRRGLQGAGIPVENSKGEADAGQAEINVRYGPALDMADTHAIIKNAAKEIAWARGRALTFLAKWHSKSAGSSSHIHQSLQDRDGNPVFHDPDAPYGMSEVMRHFLAGQLAHASEITWFLAPYVNSYKRFEAGTFAPTAAVWSRDNRTAGYRLCGEGTKAVRVECRVGGADLNPYLAMAALLAAGIAGIEQKLELEPAFEGDAYTGRRLGRIPENLRDATVALRKSKMLRAAMGDDVVDHYVHVAVWEQQEHERAVTDWEVSRGFERA